MNFLKTSVWGVAVIIANLSAGFISQKLYAYFTGNSGIITIGQFNNFSGIFYLIASGGIMNGIVHVIAKQNKNTSAVLQQIFNFLFFSSVISSIIGLFFFKYFFSLISISSNLSPVSLVLYFISLPFITFQTAILQILSAKRKVKQYSLIIVITQIINVLATALLLYFINIDGAIISLYLPSVIIFFISIFFFKNEWRMPSINFSNSFNLKLYTTLIKFSIVTLISISLLYAYQLFLRNYIVKKLDVIEASYWQTLMNFSKIWMSFILYMITVYYFPRLSSNKTKVKDEFQHFLTRMLPAVGLSFFLIFLLKNEIILLVYTKDFLGSAKYISYQLIHDLIKSSAMFFAYFTLAKGHLKSYIIMEIIYYLFLSVLSYWLLNIFKLKGVFIGQIITSIIYLVLHLINFLIYTKKQE